jgi:uncharacterized protein (TIGR02452 family)
MSTWTDLKADTITAALKYPGSISLVFASHRRPGGGFMNHERGQEEWIARRTDLVGRLQPYLNLYGDNTKPFYIILKGLQIVDTGDLRDFICVPAPLAPRKGQPVLYKDVTVELEKRIATMCGMVADYPTFIIGAWGCGFFGNKLEDVERLFRKHAKNETVVMAVK